MRTRRGRTEVTEWRDVSIALDLVLRSDRINRPAMAIHSKEHDTMTPATCDSETRFPEDRHNSSKHNDRTIIYTEKAPTPLGTYSQAVKAGNMIFLAAQTPVVPGTNEVAEGGFEGQVRQTFSNLQSMAEACGGTLADVVQVTVYITDISRFATMNTIMAEYFSPPYPARTTVGAAQLARNTLVAIDAIMVTRN